MEMQSEGGAAGALHGALQSGALTTTFTASQGLLLMIPNMYKIAGELTPAVFQVAARSLAAQGLSIFGDHSDVMAVRQTGFAMLASASVQEAHDLADGGAGRHAGDADPVRALLRRVPHLARGEHRSTCSPTTTCAPWCREELIRAHRGRALSPDRPVIRGTAQNPDVYFQARETVNPFYARIPGAVHGRDGRLRRGEPAASTASTEYSGDPEAERVIVVMGSGGQTAAETAAYLAARGEKVGVVAGPAVPAVHGRGGAGRDPGERAPAGRAGPDQGARLAGRAAVPRRARRRWPRRTGQENAPSCRWWPAAGTGCRRRSSPPVMVAGIFAELGRDRPRPRFTVGITDDVSGISLPFDPALDIEPAETVRAVFFGLGADGTVGANKNSVKILGADPARHAQAYFVYDSKKSGSETVSHLRFGLASDQGALPHRPGGLRRLPSGADERAARGARPGGAGRDRCCSTPRTRPREVWDYAAAGGSGADPGQADHPVRHQRRPGRPRRRAGLAGEHRPADLLFRHLRESCRAMRRSRAIKAADRQDLQPARPRGRRPQRRRRGRGTWRPCTGSRSPDGSRPPGACRRSSRRTRRSSSAP